MGHIAAFALVVHAVAEMNGAVGKMVDGEPVDVEANIAGVHQNGHNEEVVFICQPGLEGLPGEFGGAVWFDALHAPHTKIVAIHGFAARINAHQQGQVAAVRIWFSIKGIVTVKINHPVILIVQDQADD